MNKKKFENQIKELNAIRAKHHRDFNEIEKRYNMKVISDKIFEKQKRKYESKIEKLKEKIRKIEEKSEKKNDEIIREKRYMAWSGKNEN